MDMLKVPPPRFAGNAPAARTRLRALPAEDRAPEPPVEAPLHLGPKVEGGRERKRKGKKLSNDPTNCPIPAEKGRE
jgi:hypothetical protein